MLDMQNVGRNITKCRKAQDMTQMELADRMNISFQAVSPWERGNTLPDVSRLPELARMLCVTVDALLGTDNAVLLAAVESEEKLEKALETAQVGEISEAAPLLRPSQVEKALEKLPEDVEFDAVAALLPFVGEEIADAWALRLYEAGDAEKLRRILPYVGKAGWKPVWSLFQEDMLEGNERADHDMRWIVLPNADLTREESAAFLEQLRLRGLYENMGQVAPFMEKTALAEAARALAQDERKEARDCVRGIAPSLDAAVNDAIARLWLETDRENLSLFGMFMSEACHEQVLGQLLRDGDLHALYGIAMHMDKTKLQKLAREKMQME